jgi:hypothetical protein
VRHSHGLRAAAGNGYVIGQPLEGGYFAGYISHTQNGVPTHALIVAPKATGASGGGYTLTTNYQWKTTSTATTGTVSLFDGAANTAAIVTAGIAAHPAANFCVGLSIGGYSDWYLPAFYELDIAYQNLKPSTTSNSTSQGINPYSVPERTTNRTTTVPTQTSVAAFQTGGAEAFVVPGAMWTSTEVAVTPVNAFYITWDNGSQQEQIKTGTLTRTRAFRKIAV